MKLNKYFDNITLSPFKEEIASYSVPSFLSDFRAGLSVSLLTMPQAMAYGLMAGLPLSTGLFSAIFAGFFASFLGYSRYLVLGPSNAIAILIQYGIGEIMYTHYRHFTGVEHEQMAIQVLTQLTLLVGIFHLLASTFGLGRLTQFVSQSVIVGYIAGCAVAIAVSQSHIILGIPPAENVYSVFDRATYIFSHLKDFHGITLLVGLGSLFLLMSLKKWDKKVPTAALTFIVATVAVYLIHLVSPNNIREVVLVGDVGDVMSLRPVIGLPYLDLSLINELIPIAFAVSLLSILETNSVSKSVSAATGEPPSIAQEIFALGCGNFVSSFVGGLPISGSLSRTLLNIVSGAKTRFAAVFGAMFVGLNLYSFGDFVMLIPVSALAALLLVTALSIINKKQLLLCLKATKADAFVFWITFLSCIFLSMDIAFYIGVSLSITSYLSKSSVPQVLQYVIDKTGKLKKLELCSPDEIGKVRFIKVRGELFFGAVDLFQATLKSIAQDNRGTRVIVLHLKGARDIDATACLAFQQLYEFLSGSNRYLLMTGLTSQVWGVLSDSGLVTQIGEENLFLIDDKQPAQYIEKAMKRALDLSLLNEIKEAPIHTDSLLVDIKAKI